MSLPPVEIPLGAMRFNSDSQKLEYWNGQIWMQIHTFSPDLNGGTRGIFSGGRNSNVIQYITISTAGNASDFGDATINHEGGAASSRVRYCGTGTLGYSNVIDYVTFATTGDAVDFGDLTASEFQKAGASDSHGGIG